MLLELLQKSISENPDNIAIEFENHKITYQNLHKIIGKLANGLLQIYIKKGDRVAVILPNLPHFIFAYYATFKIGAILVPINPLFQITKIQQIFDETQPSAYLIWERFYKQLHQIIPENSNVLNLGNSDLPGTKSLTNIIANAPSEMPDIPINAKDTAIIQYTQGVSDLSKGIELTHNNITFTTTHFNKSFTFNSKDIYGGFLPLFLLYAQNIMMNSCLLNGAKLHLYPKLNSEYLIKAIHQDKITFLVGSPAMFDTIVKENPDKVENSPLKYALSFGARCSESLQTDFKQQFEISILDGYGITESSALISYNRHSASDQKLGSVGIPMDGLKVKIVDEKGNELKPNEIGEIIVAGENVMKGYWNFSSPTGQIIQNDWLYTGDMGKMDEEGFLYFIDRKEDVILKGGFSIYPSEVENILRKHPKINEVSIVGISHPVHKQEVKACVVLKENQELTAEEIIAFCKEHAPVYKCPQIIQFYDTLPKSTTGKILKRKLRN